VIFSFLMLVGVMGAPLLPPVWAATDYARVKTGVTPPKLRHSVDPQYTVQAREVGIEGKVVLQVVISKTGKVTHASVLSPLPCGLDAKALDAVAQWQFEPAVMDGELIPVLTTVDVVFRLPYQSIDHLREQARIALANNAADVARVKQLAARGLVEAIGLLGRWQAQGLGVPKDVAGGMAAIRFAAEHNDARSLYFLGQVQRAAYFGDWEAQRALAEKDEQAADLNGAKWYFRLCAATAHASCEYALGRLLVAGPGVNPNDFTQGIAWLELAAEHGDQAAADLSKQSTAKLSSIQTDWVAELKPHLELRGYQGF
jgi:TonB family protein